jgi:2-polyprenyl-3-methyl-5-hydroxy-6-metoxy-1,4-benzoquinol methylase
MSDYKTKVLDGVKYKYSSDWIYELESKEHWSQYHEQAFLIMKYIHPHETILEIGKGSGFLSNYLKSKGYTVTTFDIDEEKKPDIVGNIVNHEFNRKFNHIVGFEVFEHIPYKMFEQALKNLHNSCDGTIILSVPKNEKVWATISIKTLLFTCKFRISTRRKKMTAENHFWALEYKNFTIKRLKESLKKASFDFVESKQLDSAYFFVFKKMKIEQSNR